MKVDTKKSNIQIVTIRLLGELAANAGAAVLPLQTHQQDILGDRFQLRT